MPSSKSRTVARDDERHLRRALQLAQRGYGTTSPNPMVGAVLVRKGQTLGEGWHQRAGESHAEIAAIRRAQARGHDLRGSTLYVTLEPCSTQGRTPPCTDAIIAARIRRVVSGTLDPNPRHRGRGLRKLARAGIEVAQGILTEACTQLNASFNHWIVQGTPYVTVKAAMTLDGKIATRTGESKWITGPKARAYGMQLRHGVDAILVGVNTIVADDPRLTLRQPKNAVLKNKLLRRFILDTRARTPLTSRILCESRAHLTTVVVGRSAPQRRVKALAHKVKVLEAPCRGGRIDLRWLMRRLGADDITHLLVEGGGEVNASFLLQRLAHRIVFFYAPKILGGRTAQRAVAGEGASSWSQIVRLERLEWKRLGPDLLLEAQVS